MQAEQSAIKQYLAELQVPIKQIARMVGFDDQYHFSRVFRKVTGIAPSQFAVIVRPRSLE